MHDRPYPKRDAKLAQTEVMHRSAIAGTLDLEARANTKPLSKEEAAKTVDWDEIYGSENVSGTLVRVECVGRQLRLEVKDGAGKTLRLLVTDPSQAEISGEDPTLACGPQKPRPVKITYKAGKGKNGVSGEATRIEFPR